ncbi:hypothetical protein LCGC14_3034870, partial [marine sediment metagenome]
MVSRYNYFIMPGSQTCYKQNYGHIIGWFSAGMRYKRHVCSKYKRMAIFIFAFNSDGVIPAHGIVGFERKVFLEDYGV